MYFLMKKAPGDLRKNLRYSAVGLEFSLSVIIGMALGWQLDKAYDTRPYLTMAGLLFGVAAGVMAIIRMYRRVMKEWEEEEAASTKASSQE